MYCIFLRVAHFVHRNFLFCTDLDSLIRKFCLFSFSLLHYLSNKEFCKGVSVKENLYHHCQYWTSFLARLIHKIKWITYQKKENFLRNLCEKLSEVCSDAVSFLNLKLSISSGRNEKLTR